MTVLVDCEESQAVTIAFRELGHEAYSCDLQDCSGGYPEWHMKMDAISALYARKWDLVVAHPTCTRLANSGVRWLTSRTPRTGYEWSEQENIFINSDISVWEALYAPKDKQERVKWQKVLTASPGPQRAILRSKTYSGIAKAIAEQSYCLIEKTKAA